MSNPATETLYVVVEREVDLYQCCPALFAGRLPGLHLTFH